MSAFGLGVEGGARSTGEGPGTRSCAPGESVWYTDEPFKILLAVGLCGAHEKKAVGWGLTCSRGTRWAAWTGGIATRPRSAAGTHAQTQGRRHLRLTPVGRVPGAPPS